jgi:competence protein ComGC
MKRKNEEGFTLIEMMIVIMIISVLLLIVVPSMSKNNTVVKQRSCDATIQVIEAQVAAYEAETGTQASSLADLVNNEYFNSESYNSATEEFICTDGREITVANGKLVENEPSSTQQ